MIIFVWILTKPTIFLLTLAQVLTNAILFCQKYAEKVRVMLFLATLWLPNKLKTPQNQAIKRGLEYRRPGQNPIIKGN